MTPEGKVKKKVNAVLKMFERATWRFMPVQTGYGAPALDYLCCVNGVFVAIETKVKGKNLTPLQESTRSHIEAAGGLVFVVSDDRSLWIATRCLLQLIQGNQHAIQFVRQWRDDANLQAQDEGTCSELLRQFLKDKAVVSTTGGHHGASGTAP